MSDLEIIGKLKDLLDLPIFIRSEDQHPGMDRLTDPFSFIEWNQNTIIPEQLRLILTPHIIQLLDIVENGQTNERVRAIQRLIKSYEIKGLSSIEEERFGRALWSRCNPTTGLPSDTGLRNASFLYLPESESGISRNKMELYLSSSGIPKIFISTTSADGKTSISTSSGSAFIDYIHDWGIATSPINPNEGKNIEKSIDWTPDDTFNLLLKIKKMWDEDKATIIRYKENSDGFGLFKSNIDHEIWGILELLRVVILPRFLKIEKPEAKQIITQLFDEMESNNISTNSLIALQISIEPKNMKNYLVN